MSFEKIFLKPEDDTDFLPIIPLNESEGDNADGIEIPTEIPILPLRNTVLFPGVVLPITVGRDKSIKAVNDAYKADKLVGVLAQKDSTIEDPAFSDLVSIGTVAKIVKQIKMPDGGTTIIIQGKSRFMVESSIADEPYFKAKIQTLPEDESPKDPDFEAYVSNIKDLATEIIQLSPNIPSEASIILRNIESPSFLIHFVSGNLNTDIKEKQRLLELNNIRERADLLMQLLQKELQFAELKNKVTNKTKAELDKQQRDYFLQQQLKSIKDELGGDSNLQEIKQMQKKAETKKWPASAKEMFQKGIEKLERMHPTTPDYSIVYNHLDLMLELLLTESGGGGDFEDVRAGCKLGDVETGRRRAERPRWLALWHHDQLPPLQRGLPQVSGHGSPAEKTHSSRLPSELCGHHHQPLCFTNSTRI